MSRKLLPVIDANHASGERVDMQRRRFFAAATAVSASALVSACGDGFIDGPGHISPTPGAPLRVDPRSLSKLGRIGGVAVVQQDGFAPIALTRTGDRSYTAVSLICPHKGTTVGVTDTGFRCPNHGAMFAADGTWSGGKETGDLTVLGVSLEDDGTLLIGGIAAPSPSPAIAVSPSAEVFTMVHGESAPAPQTIAVNNTGGGTLNAIGLTIGYNAGEPLGWLTGQIDTAVAPSVITLTPDPGTLPAGVYNATVNISSGSASNGPVPVSVTFVIMEPASPPNVSLSPGTLSFATTQGTRPPAQTVQLTNSGGGTLSGITVGSPQYLQSTRGWLAVTASGTSAPTTLSVNVDVTDIAPGTYTAAVSVLGEGPRTQGETLTVVLIVDTLRTTPSIVALPRQLSFAAAPGDANPTPQTVSITNGGVGTLSALNIGAITYGATASDWLTATLDATTAPATLRVSPRTGALPEGTHVAYVPVRSGTASNSPQEIAVSFVVSPRTVSPEIALSPVSLSFATVQGNSPAPGQVAISNASAGTLGGLAVGTIAYGAGASGWLSAALNGATAPAILTITPSVSSLLPGTYSADVPVTSPLASNSPQKVSVTLTVSAVGAPPSISMSSTAASFTVSVGANPSAQSLSVQNGGGGALTGLSLGAVTYSGGATGWLTPSLSAASAPATIALNVGSAAIAPGTYSATFSVSSTLAGVLSRSITVSLIVNAGPDIALSASAVTFTAQQGSSPAAQSLTISNGGGGALTALTLGAIAYGAGATGWLSASLSGTNAPSTLLFTVLSSSLAAGTYSATIQLASAVASNSPRTITVTLTITSGASITLSTSAPAFSTAQGTSPASQSITVTNGGAGALTGIAVGAVTYGAGASGWLTVTPSGVTAPVTLTLTVASTALAAGTYTATFVVSATGASAQTVTVTLVVAGAPAIGLSATTVTMSSAAGGTPTPQTINITNSGGGTLSGLALAFTYGGSASGWLSTSALSGTSAPSVLTIRAVTTGLAAGSYTGTVTISATGAASRSVAVTLTINAAGLAVVIANWPALATVGGIVGTVGTVSGTPTAVVRTGQDTYAAYSMRCPHQGTTCKIENWKSTGSAFHCPNHDAIFTSSGVNMPNSPQKTSNMVMRTVTYTPGDTTLYIS